MSNFSKYLVIIFVLAVANADAHADGVLVSSGARTGAPAQPADQDRRQMISDFTQQVLYATMLEQTTDVMQRYLQQSNVDLMANFVQLAIQQAAMQTFQQEQTMNIIRDIFNQCVDIGMDDFDKGKAGEEIQSHIRETAKRELAALTQNRVYQEIIRVIIENAWQSQQQVVAQQVMQQRVEQMIQQQVAMQRAAEEQYRRQLLQGAMAR